jgi:hypothetical protein
MPNDALGRIYPPVTEQFKAALRVFEPSADNIKNLLQRGERFGPWLNAQIILLRIYARSYDLSAREDLLASAMADGRITEAWQIASLLNFPVLITDHSEHVFSGAQRWLRDAWHTHLRHAAETPATSPSRIWPNVDGLYRGYEVRDFRAALRRPTVAGLPRVFFCNANGFRARTAPSEWDDCQPFILPQYAFPFVLGNGRTLVDSAEYAVGRLAKVIEELAAKKFPSLCSLCSAKNEILG